MKHMQREQRCVACDGSIHFGLGQAAVPLQLAIFVSFFTVPNRLPA